MLPYCIQSEEYELFSVDTISKHVLSSQELPRYECLPSPSGSVYNSKHIDMNPTVQGGPVSHI